VPVPVPVPGVAATQQTDTSVWSQLQSHMSPQSGSTHEMLPGLGRSSKSAGHVNAIQDVASNEVGSLDGCGVAATQQTDTSVWSQLQSHMSPQSGSTHEMLPGLGRSSKSAGHVNAIQDVASNLDGSPDGCEDGAADGV